MLFKQLRRSLRGLARVRLEAHDHYGRRDLYFETAYLIDDRFDDFFVRCVYATKSDPGVIRIEIWYR